MGWDEEKRGREEVYGRWNGLFCKESDRGRRENRGDLERRKVED
jgi:hypothetical protein